MAPGTCTVANENGKSQHFIISIWLKYRYNKGLLVNNKLKDSVIFFCGTSLRDATEKYTTTHIQGA